MKVKDLIKALQAIDPSKEVFVLDEKERVYSINTIGVWIKEKPSVKTGNQ